MAKEISRTALKEKMDNNEDFVLVEALKAEDYRKMHLPGAINLPVDDESFSEKARKKIPHLDTTVVVYCWDKDCDASSKAAKKLEDLGYQNVFDYVEGKKDWRDAGFETKGSDAAA